MLHGTGRARDASDISTESRSVSSATAVRVRFVGKPGRTLSGPPAAGSAPLVVQQFQFPDTARAAIPTFRTSERIRKTPRSEEHSQMQGVLCI
jgi:hypothetical protein